MHDKVRTYDLQEPRLTIVSNTKSARAGSYDNVEPQIFKQGYKRRYLTSGRQEPNLTAMSNVSPSGAEIDDGVEDSCHQAEH